MSRRLNCGGDAVAESFFSNLKKERIKKRIYKTSDLAKEDIFDYIEELHNRTRSHSHLGGVSLEWEGFEAASKWGSGLSMKDGGVQSRCAFVVSICLHFI